MMFDIGYSSSGPGMDDILSGIDALNGADALVGIPEGDNRKADLLFLAGNIKLTKTGKVSKTARKLLEAAKSPITNAELLFIFTNGSPLRGQPPRVVIEAAIESEPTRTLLAKEIAAASVSALSGDEKGMIEHLDRAGTIAESASKRWFTDPRNGWEPNAPSTIRSKGSDAAGIDTGQMRRAITHIVEAGHGVHSAAIPPSPKQSIPAEAAGVTQGNLEKEIEQITKKTGSTFKEGAKEIASTAIEYGVTLGRGFEDIEDEAGEALEGIADIL